MGQGNAVMDDKTFSELVESVKEGGKILRDMATGELTIIINKFAKAERVSLEKVLAQFRSACNSDEEFSERMSVSRDIPSVDQYWFDMTPAFYTLFEIKGNVASFTFHVGKYPA